LVEDIRRAISDRRVVSFHYIDSDGHKTERRVEPFSLVIGGVVWYLHAWCRLRGDFRLFKLARVTDARLELERFDPFARTPIPPPFVRGDEPSIPVVLEAEAALSVALDESFPGADIEDRPGGTRLYRFRYPIGPWFVRLLLYFGPGLRVREPAELREAYSQALRRMAEDNGC
jgi:predicted DNA-binding transcriptional regulator YafY